MSEATEAPASTTVAANLAVRARRLLQRGLPLLLVSVLAACGSKPQRAPVEERSVRPPVASNTQPAPAAEPERRPPGWENAGQPGYYTVKAGDTLVRIGMEQGQSWRDIARWNGLENVNQIEVGQVLRVVPPPGEVATARPVPAPRLDTRPLEPPKPVPTTPPAATPAVPAPAAPAAAAASDDELSFSWPASGNVLYGFDESRQLKGIAVGGKAGDAVYAAADGRVVYAGSGLRSYGNLIIIKHNNVYLTAYAHNQTLLVKDDQQVRRGQKIAEMGSSDADSVRLHFEIRRQGKPVDPLKLLPQR